MDPRGPCSKIGQEVWMVRAGRLQVGTVMSINTERQIVVVRTSEGDREFSPISSILMTAGPGRTKKK